MNQEVIDFLKRERVCSLTTMVDGAPYSSAMHFSFNEDPLKLYFSTKSDSKKCKSIIDIGKTQAAVAIGFSETEWLTLQMEGEVKVVPDEDLGEIKISHYARHPESQKFENDPKTVFLEFTPTWWKYSDFKSHPPKTYSSS